MFFLPVQDQTDAQAQVRVHQATRYSGCYETFLHLLPYVVNDVYDVNGGGLYVFFVGHYPSYVLSVMMRR